METTKNDGAKLYHLDVKDKKTDIREHYYFANLADMMSYFERYKEDFEGCYTWAYIMQLNDDGMFVDVWECSDISILL